MKLRIGDPLWIKSVKEERTVSAIEVYISVDVETSGPIPGKYSMLSLGACEVGHSERSFYVELRPTSQRYEPQAMQVVGRSLADLRIRVGTPVTL